MQYNSGQYRRRGGGMLDISLIAIRLARPLTEEERTCFAGILPPERRERLAKLARPELADEPLCAYAALQMGLYRLYGKKTMPLMKYNRYGKPMFIDCPEIHFNISHTRGAVLVGIHDQPLGVDIERIRPVSERTMQRLADVTTEKEFFESWVRRESRSKWSGTGLAAMRRSDAPTMYGERFCFVETFPDYVACVCTHSRDAVAPVDGYTIS